MGCVSMRRPHDNRNGAIGRQFDAVIFKAGFLHGFYCPFQAFPVPARNCCWPAGLRCARFFFITHDMKSRRAARASSSLHFAQDLRLKADRFPAIHRAGLLMSVRRIRLPV